MCKRWCFVATEWAKRVWNALYKLRVNMLLITSCIIYSQLFMHNITSINDGRREQQSYYNEHVAFEDRWTHGQMNRCFASGASFTSGQWNPVSKYESWESWENHLTTGK